MYSISTTVPHTSNEFSALDIVLKMFFLLSGQIIQPTEVVTNVSIVDQKTTVKMSGQYPVLLNNQLQNNLKKLTEVCATRKSAIIMSYLLNMFECSVRIKERVKFFLPRHNEKIWTNNWAVPVTCSNDIVLLKIDIFTYSKEIRLSTFLSPIIQHNDSHLSPEEDIQLIRYVTNYVQNVPFT